VAALCAASYLLLLAPGAAEAGQSACSYYGGSLCIWTGTGYTGDFFVGQYGTVPSNQYLNLPPSIADEDGSLWNNRTTYRTWVASEDFGGGSQGCLNPGDEFNNLHTVWYPGMKLRTENAITSYELTTNSSACTPATHLYNNGS
jgi:hypothetical protein